MRVSALAAHLATLVGEVRSCETSSGLITDSQLIGKPVKSGAPACLPAAGLALALGLAAGLALALGAVSLPPTGWMGSTVVFS